MQYDPIKRSLGKVFNQTPALRILFYKLLDMLLLRSWHVRNELKKWRKTAPAKISILDAGSGFGQYDHFMSQLGKNDEILAVDVKTEQIADCNNFFSKIGLGKRVKFEFADLTTFSKPNTFDLIVSVDVMEHILEDEAVFANFYTSLKPGGLLMVSTPSDQGGSDADHDHDHGSPDINGFIDEHVRDGYNIDDIKQKLKRAGFKNIEARFTYGKPGSIAWRFSMKYPILMLNTSKLLFIILPLYYIITFPWVLLLNYADLKGDHKTGTGLLVKATK